jgi:general secretion pathway protein L
MARRRLAQIAMSLLRIYVSLSGPPQRCQWALVAPGRAPVAAEGSLADLPRRAERIQLVIPAAQVLITHARVPRTARRRAGSMLAFAVEERTAGEPDTNQVSWLGSAGDDDVLAVVDKPGLTRWQDALAAAGIRGFEVQSETLLLPRKADEWSLAWNGRDGFVRTGEFEGAPTDCGEHDTPPLSLRLMLEEAQARGTRPAAIALYMAGPAAAPDVEAWARELGVAMRLAGTWDWRAAPPDAGVSLAQERRHWRSLPGAAVRLRPAAWILAGALAVHAAALVVDWTSLANEQRMLRQRMESRFRATFPDTVAVVDPVLQMRRKLAEARHGAGQPDSGDYLPMVGRVAAAAKGLPAGAVRVMSYEGGRLTLAFGAIEDAAIRNAMARLSESGLAVDMSGKNLITVRAP